MVTINPSEDWPEGGPRTPQGWAAGIDWEAVMAALPSVGGCAGWIVQFPHGRWALIARGHHEARELDRLPVAVPGAMLLTDYAETVYVDGWPFLVFATEQIHGAGGAA
jgi:hypothetical protein